MAYSAEISRGNPSCVVFVIDQSGSMADAVGGDPRPKAEWLATIINRCLKELVLSCAKEEGIRNYFHVGVIGYGSSVGSAFVGPLAGRELVPVKDVADQPARMEDRTQKVDDENGGLVDTKVRVPIWFDPVANNGTPMCQVFRQVRTTVQGWLTDHPDCFPPRVIHITDGESSDGDPTEDIRAVTQLSSSDGNVLLFNIHLSSGSKVQVAFPSSEETLPDEYARLLFRTASPLTPFMRQIARDHGYSLDESARGFVLNAENTLAIQAIDIGTRPSNLR